MLSHESTSYKCWKSCLQRSFEMVVLYGRRRVGKTALIDEFVKDKRVLYFTAIQQSAKMNLEDFSRAALSFFGMPDSTPSFGGWSDALSFVAERAAQTDERMVFVFDEFPYAAAAEPALPSMLQIAIDHGFLATKVTMILSGSNEGFMENDVLGRKSRYTGVVQHRFDSCHSTMRMRQNF